MFQRSGPGHMLLLTVQNKIVQDQISLSLAKVKVKFGTKGHTWRSLKGKKITEPMVISRTAFQMAVVYF